MTPWGRVVPAPFATLHQKRYLACLSPAREQRTGTRYFFSGPQHTAETEYRYHWEFNLRRVKAHVRASGWGCGCVHRWTGEWVRGEMDERVDEWVDGERGELYINLTKRKKLVLVINK